MGSLKMVLSSSLSDDTLEQNYQRPTSAKYANVQAISQLFEKLCSGGLKGASGSAPSVSVKVDGEETAASGTFTFSSIANTNTLAINGVTFTCVTSGATGNQFNVGASDTAAAANAVIAINASVTALVSGYVVATSALGVVTITSAFKGLSGNQVTIVGGTHVTASGARLTGGATDPGAQTYSF